MLIAHEKYVRAGVPIPNAATALVRSLQNRMADVADDLNVVYPPNTDVLPALMAVLDEIVTEPPVLLEQIEPEQIEIKRREQQKWRQYVSRRGLPALNSNAKSEKRMGFAASCAELVFRLQS